MMEASNIPNPDDGDMNVSKISSSNGVKSENGGGIVKKSLSRSKVSLMASLTGEDPLQVEEGDSDLFGTIPKQKPSVLASSGLLDGGGGGGLFDQVDEDLRAREEAEKAERERAAQLKAQAEAEAAAAAAAAAAAQQQQQQQAFLQQQQQQLQQQLQQQQPQYRLDGRMQDLNLQDHHHNNNNNNNNQNNGFYRPDQPPQQPQPPQQQQQQQQPPVVQQGYGAASYYYSTSGHATTVEQPKPVATTTAGMHNHPTTDSFIPTKPNDQTLKEFTPLYGPIRVSDPLLVQGSGLFSGPPHWTYQVTVTNPQPINGTEYATTNQVRRRFRHFVALEDRLRMDCPGAILPPR